MQDLSLLVIDEGQQYGTDREIAVISLPKQQRTGRGRSGDASRLFVMTTATDHKNTLNSSTWRKNISAHCEWKLLLTQQEARQKLQ